MNSPTRKSIFTVILAVALMLSMSPLALADGGAQGSGQDPPEPPGGGGVMDSLPEAFVEPLVELTSVLLRVVAL